MAFKSGNSPSYWEKTSFLAHRNIVIIGSGIVGLTTSIYLKRQQPHRSVLVIDRGSIPTGASTRNAGFACFGSPSELLADQKSQGWDQLLQLVEKRFRGLQLLRELLSEQTIDYQACGGVEVFTEDQDKLYSECMDMLDELNRELSFISPKAFSPAAKPPWGLHNFYRAIHCNEEGSLHPGQMTKALVQIAQKLGVDFLNGVQISGFTEHADKCEIITNQFKITCDLMLVATNAFAKDLLPDLELVPGRNQVLVTSPIPHLQLAGVCHYDAGYVYFRNIGSRVLIGGARNHFLDQERTSEFGNTQNVISHLENLLRTKVIPGASFTIDDQWSGILGLGQIKTPVVQWQSDRIFAACRMGGMGISIGAYIGKTAAGELLRH